MICLRKNLLSATALFAGIFVLGENSAQAGFQFSSQPTQQQAAPAPVAHENAPMPIVPAPTVEAMPLEAAPFASPSGQPVYVHRQRETTINQIPMKAAASNQGLVINPYPLQQTGVSVQHGIESGQLSLDQAMMEETGHLKAVKTPGAQSASGMVARATISSRFDSNATTPPPVPVSQQIDYGSATSLTPIPGGEGQNLYDAMASSSMPVIVERKPLAVQPAPANIYPAPAIPMRALAQPSQQFTGFSEAVGFGRDLPLALALSQIVPADYSFSFGQSVNAGETVSWQGGKSWDAVLQEMLAPHGMRAVITGKQVVIHGAA